MPRQVALLLFALSTACRHQVSPAGPGQPAAAAAPVAPSRAGIILFMGVDLPPSGTVIGGHYGGAQFGVRQASYQLSESVRARWSETERARGEAIMRAAGYVVRGVGPGSSDAQQLLGVQYGLTGHVTDLQLRSAGTAEPLTVDVQLDVSWELLDLGAGSAVFGHLVHTATRVAGTVDFGVDQALDDALTRLLGDTLFLRALGVPRALPEAGNGPVAQRSPVGSAPIELDESDLNPSVDTSVVGRITAGLVMLRGQGGRLGTAVMLTRDGLALAVGRTARTASVQLRARLASGIEAPVRLLRSSAALDVALLQVACPGACATVDWDAPDGVDVFTGALAVGAPEADDQPVTTVVGRVGGRWGLAQGITMEGTGGQAGGGWPVARTSSGRVFGLVSTRPGRPTVVLLAEVLRALHVRAPASRR